MPRAIREAGSLDREPTARNNTPDTAIISEMIAITANNSTSENPPAAKACIPSPALPQCDRVPRAMPESMGLLSNIALKLAPCALNFQ